MDSITNTLSKDVTYRAVERLAAFSEGIREAARKAGLLHTDGRLTDEELLALLVNVGDLAHQARLHLVR